MQTNQPDLFSNPVNPRTITPAEILDATRRMLGGVAPYICFGVAQHEAWIKTSLIGSTPDLDRCIRKATRHVADVDPTDEAAAAMHAGMLLVAALKSGMAAEDAGVVATDAICGLLGLGKLMVDPDMDY